MTNISSFDFYKIVANGPEVKCITFIDNDSRILIGKFFADGSETLYCIKTGNYNTIISGIPSYTFVPINQL